MCPAREVEVTAPSNKRTSTFELNRILSHVMHVKKFGHSTKLLATERLQECSDFVRLPAVEFALWSKGICVYCHSKIPDCSGCHSSAVVNVSFRSVVHRVYPHLSTVVSTSRDGHAKSGRNPFSRPFQSTQRCVRLRRREPWLETGSGRGLSAGTH